MGYTLEDMLDGLRSSRGFFLKHLRGLQPEQWDWKPYPECKSIRETVAHLIVDDLAALQSMQTGSEPDYEGLNQQVADGGTDDTASLLARLEQTHEDLVRAISQRYTGKPLDADICIFGHVQKLAGGVAYLSAEDFYHAGQVAFIRQATDPSWEYYGAIYGGD